MNSKHVLTTLFFLSRSSEVLERWVEQGEVLQSNPTVKSDAEANVLWTRPICPYTQREVYSGEGDVNDTSNFECVEY